MVYGQIINLPGEFFTPSPVPALSSQQQIIQDLRATFRTLHPTAPRCLPSDRPGLVSPHLQNSSHVFVRHDAIRPSLVPAYDGPLKILARSRNTMTLDINGRIDVVALERVKFALLDTTIC